MSQKNTKKQGQDIGELILFAIKMIFIIGFIVLVFWGYFNIYNPVLRNFIKKSNYVFKAFQTETIDLIRNKNYQYTEHEEDDICKILKNKYAEGIGNCSNMSQGFYSSNFVIKDKKIEIFGLEKPAYKMNGVLVKDFYLDVDGEKEGENEMGIDRAPLRIYLEGRMKGLLTPINCKKLDEKDFSFYYAPICAGTPEINYMETNIPFGFDVLQIGGNHGKTKVINSNVPFLRADCTAFGGEMVVVDDYCDAKRYYALSACYDEYTCAVEISQTNF